MSPEVCFVGPETRFEGGANSAGREAVTRLARREPRATPQGRMSETLPTFGRYVVLDTLVGASGERTIVAFDPKLDRKVGLKVFGVASEQSLARRRERARSLAALAHPHVARVHDVGTNEGRLFVAMEFVEGHTLGSWVEDRSPPWSRVLEACLAAGQGLAAAHAAGLIHGCLDADAVVVGEDGLVRVIDFVRSTPRLGAAPDDGCDRIDWCAMTFEALWGAPPGPRPEVPGHSPVPRAMRRVILEGLTARSRWTTVESVVHQLRRIVRRRRRVGAATVAAVTTVTAATFVLTQPPPSVDIHPWCEGIETRLSAVWNDDVSRQGHATFAATGVPYADRSWETVQTQVQGFTQAWREAAALHCAPSDSSPTDNAAITICLHRQFQALEALAEAVGTADASVVANATKAAASLGVPASCHREDQQGRSYAEADLDKQFMVESTLSRARMQRHLGRYAEAVQTATQARTQAQAVGVRALAAEAEYGVALSRARVGEEDAAESGYHEAFSEAFASRHHEIVARSALDLTQLLVEQGRHEESVRWIEHAAAAIERHDTNALQMDLAATRGLAAYRRGKHEDARRHYEHSLELAANAEPPDDFGKMHATQALSNVMGRMGDTPAQIELLEGSLAFAEQKLGREHPSVGHHLNSLAAALSRRGSTDLARQANRRAEAIFLAAFGEDHASTISARTNLAAALHEAGKDDEAREVYTALLASAQRTFSVDDPRYVNVLGNVGMFETLQGNTVRAVELLSEAAARNEAVSGPDHVHTLGFLNNLAATYLFSDQYEKAREVYLKILVRTGRALGEDHPNLLPCLLGLARVEHELGRPLDATRYLQRALKIGMAKQVRPEQLATVRFALARAMLDGKLDRAQALETARAALQNYVAAGDEGWEVADSLATVRAWLEEHGG